MKERSITISKSRMAFSIYFMWLHESMLHDRNIRIYNSMKDDQDALLKTAEENEQWLKYSQECYKTFRELYKNMDSEEQEKTKHLMKHSILWDHLMR